MPANTSKKTPFNREQQALLVLAEIYRLALMFQEKEAAQSPNILRRKLFSEGIADRIALKGSPTEARLFYDITLLTRHKRFTSIDRVVMQLLAELQNLELPVTPIVHTDKGWRPFKPKMIATGRIEGNLFSDPLDPRPGDRLLLAEIDYGLPASAFTEIIAMKSQGLKVDTMVYDMFYLTRPHWFTVEQVLKFHSWLTKLHQVADRALCNSFHCADQLALWRCLAKPLLPIRTDIPIAVFPLGADGIGSRPSQQFKASNEAHDFTLPQSGTPTFLSIASLHYRKGVDLLLDAFQTLWQSGLDVRLVLTGINRDQRLAQQIANHPELGNRLFYPGFLGDQQITDIAKICDALIIPSREEGFGLPLVEADQIGLPVIARDIPVFREIAGEKPFYFNEEKGKSLASCLYDWLRLSAAEKHAHRTQQVAISWHQSAKQLAEILFSSLSYREDQENPGTVKQASLPHHLPNNSHFE